MSKKKWFILACMGMLSLGMSNVNVVNAATLESSAQEVSTINSEGVFREGDFECTVLEDGTLQVSYYPLEEVTITELTIPSEIDGKTVTSIGGVWDENVTQINIPDTINNIVAYAFSGSKKFETITVYGDAETMPALSIGRSVFSCESIKYIDEKLLTNVAYIGEYAFKTASISALNIRGNNIEVMGYAFGEYLEKLSIVGNNVIIHDDAFRSAKNLEEISLQGVTELGEKAFERAGYIPYNNMIKMEISGNGFDFPKSNYDKVNDQFINLKELKLKGVEHIGDYAFDKCESLEVLEFADGLLSIGYANFNNTKLKEVALPNSVQELQSSFRGCLELEKVTTYGTNISQSVDNRFAGFAGCTNLKELQIPKSIGQIGSISSRYGVDSLDSLESVIIPDGCVKIDVSAFEECDSLETIVLPNSLSVIGQRAFYGCDSLKTIEFVGDTIAEEGLTLDSSAFGYCDNLKEIYLPSNTTIRIGYGVFMSCSNLEEVNLPEGVAEIGKYAFAYCEKLQDLNLPEGVVEIGEYAFAYCEKLQDLNLPESVVEIGEYAFAYCEKLKAFNIPEKVKSIEKGTFVRCTSLQEIIIPSTLTEFSEEAFCDDHGIFGDYELRAISVEEGHPNYSTQDGILFNKDKTELLLYPFAKEEESYIIPSSVIRIGKCAFALCQLNEIEFPDKLHTIDDYAFYNSHVFMNEFDFGDSLVKIGKAAFDRMWTNCDSIIRIPSSLEYIGSSGLSVDNDVQVYFYAKDCVIDGVLNGSHYWSDEDWLIYGYPDSTAYTYAETYAIPFFDIETGEQLLPIVEATATPAPTVEPIATPIPTVSPTVTPVPTVEPIVTPAPTEAPSTTSFVTRMYQQCLSRDPDQAGLEGWVGQLENGNMDGAAIAEQFVFSQEMLDKNLSDEAFVDILYTSMMGRTADAAGKGGWVSQLSNQYMTRSEVTKAFVESKEFTEICNSYGIARGTYDASIAPIEHFVSRFYSLCLERNADQAGLYGWVGNLKNQYMNGAQIANAFFFSKEFVGRNVSDEKYVELLYNTLMGRPSDAAGKSGWVNQLQNGYMTREVMMKAFIESTEFTGICESYGIVRGSL